MLQKDLIKSSEEDRDAPDCKYVLIGVSTVSLNFANFFLFGQQLPTQKKTIQNVQLAN